MENLALKAYLPVPFTDTSCPISKKKLQGLLKCKRRHSKTEQALEPDSENAEILELSD